MGMCLVGLEQGVCVEEGREVGWIGLICFNE